MLELTLNVRDQRLLLGPGFCFRRGVDRFMIRFSCQLSSEEKAKGEKEISDAFRSTLISV